MTDQERFAAVDRYIANLLLRDPAREPDRAVGAERADLERSAHLDRRVQRGVARRLLELIVRMRGGAGGAGVRTR
jgi:hypothetical protein